MLPISLKLNGKYISKIVPDNTLLVEFLRETLGLTGTHIGCDTSQCGACLVQIDGEAIKSCAMLAAEAIDSEILTIEGIADEMGQLSPLQLAFRKNHGLQCGFCTPGMIIILADLLKNNESPSEKEIREYLEGNICRCTGYQNIVKSVQEVSQDMLRYNQFDD